MRGFTFFASYYDAIKGLKDEEQLQLYQAIMSYVFEGEEPELSGNVLSFFILMRPNLDTSKRRSESGSKGGRPRSEKRAFTNKKSSALKGEKSKLKANKKQNENKSKAMTSLSLSYSLSSNEDKKQSKDKDSPPLSPPRGKNLTATQMIEQKGYAKPLEEAVLSWVKYKHEKRQAYKEQGLKAFLTEIQNKAAEFGDEAVIDVINLSMSQNWQGVTWEKLNYKGVKNGKSTTEGWGKSDDPYARWRGRTSNNPGG